MDAKEYLQQIRLLDTVIAQKRREVDDLHDIATAIGSFDYTQDRVQTSPKGEAPYTKTAEKAAEVDREIDALEGTRLHIIAQIQNLDDWRYTDLLYKRYAEYKRFDEIADEMGYEATYTRALHVEALKAFEETYTILQTCVIL